MADMALYPGFSNVPSEKEIYFKFFPDAGNQPTVPSAPLNLWISSIVWVSQGLYRITLQHAYKNIVSVDAHIGVNGAGVARWVQPGPVANVGTSTAVTVDLLVVDNAGAVQNPPAANSNNVIWGTIVFCDTAAV